jgi:hypothetical protein
LCQEKSGNPKTMATPMNIKQLTAHAVGPGANRKTLKFETSALL